MSSAADGLTVCSDWFVLDEIEREVVACGMLSAAEAKAGVAALLAAGYLEVRRWPGLQPQYRMTLPTSATAKRVGAAIGQW